ncbi:MAG: EAL domain-containing protein [Pseudomonadota bacterium]
MSAAQNKIATLLHQDYSQFSLRLLLPMSMLLCAAVVMAYLIPSTLDAVRQDLLKERNYDVVQHSSNLQANVDLMLKTGRHELVKSEFSAFGSDPEVTIALLSDENGKILAAMQQNLVGEQIEKALQGASLDFAGMAKQAKHTMAGIVTTIPEQNKINSVYPVLINTGTDSLRPSRVGTIVLQYDVSLTYQKKYMEAVQWLVKIGLLTLTLALIVSILLHYTVSRRIVRLLHATSRLATGDFNITTGITGKDEIGRLGQAFDALSQQMEYTTQSLNKLSYAVEQSANSVIITDHQGTIEYVNPCFCQTTGYTLQEILHRNPRILKSDHTDPATYQQMWETIASGKNWQGEFQNKRKNGSLYWDYATISPILDDSGNITHYVSIQQDITQRKHAEEQLRLGASVFENSGEAIMITDANNNIVSVNQAFTEITGYLPDEVIGRNPRLLRSSHMNRDFYREMWDALKSSGRWSGEIYDRRKSGEIYPEWLTITAVKDQTGSITHFIAIFSDITERKATEEKLRHMAQHDFLTNLPNRILLFDRLLQAIAQAERHGTQVALMFLDLDRFKNINDSLGHEVGDQLLLQVSQRLQNCVRSSDTISRQGGDEFLIMLPEIENAEAAAHVASKLLESMSMPFHIGDSEIHLTISIGISIYPDDGKDITTLIKQADTAMYHAKENGRDNYQFFAQEMTVRATERLSLESKLRRALERGEFLLHYQPQVDIPSGHIIGVEALIRWSHPEMGMISPARFIPVAEDSGLIVPIGEWVMHEACRQNRAWQDAGLPKLSVSVNLSALQFRNKNLPRTVTHALEQAQLDPSCLELEITESIIMQGAEKTISALQELKNMGIKLSIDDFGTGYSSLNYLRRFPIDRLKIDQSFIRDITHNPDDAAIIRAIISLGKSLKLKIIAEGVETREQLAFLQNHDCDELQGYYFSRPLPAEECAQMLREQRRLADALIADKL